MSRKQILERERRWAAPAAASALLALALLIGATIITQSNQAVVDNDPGFLRNYDENGGALLVAAILQALSLLLLIPSFFNLFRATAVRREGMREGLVGLTVAGPLFLALGAIAVWAGFDEAAGIFVDSFEAGGDSASDRAEDAVKDSSILVVGQGLAFAGALATGIGLGYGGLNSQRVGLTTRFWGTLGAALGVFIALAGLVGVLVYVLLQGLIGVATYAWFAMAGMVAAGWWPGRQPRAWEAGEAVPWPAPGAQREEEGEGLDPEEPGLPADVEGERGAAPEPEPAAPDSARRKRKRRG